MEILYPKTKKERKEWYNKKRVGHCQKPREFTAKKLENYIELTEHIVDLEKSN